MHSEREVDGAPAASLVSLRRDLHSHPELRFEEVRTSRRIAAEIASHVDSLQLGIGGTGMLARIEGPRPGRTVLIRSDIDAYPVTDTKQVPYRSRNPGVAHACGHDVHAAVGVGVLRHLAVHRPERGSVAVIFQPAEEIPFGADSGAATILANEAVSALRPDAVLGLHCWPQLDAGEIGIEEPIAMAAKDAFEVTVSGVSAHIATPASGRDAVLAASTLVTVLHSVLARRRDPHEQVAFNIGTISGGSSQSVLSNEVVLTGSIRTHDEAVRQRLRTVITAVVEGAAIQFDTAMKLVWANEMPAVVNDRRLAALARASLAGVTPVVELNPGPMTTDDFALYSVLAPTLYLKLGVRVPGERAPAGLHSGAFDVDESCIGTGVDVLTRLCMDILSAEDGGTDRL